LIERLEELAQDSMLDVPEKGWQYETCHQAIAALRRLQAVEALVREWRRAADAQMERQGDDTYGDIGVRRGCARDLDHVLGRETTR
jgi:hypothetical protein